MSLGGRPRSGAGRLPRRAARAHVSPGRFGPRWLTAAFAALLALAVQSFAVQTHVHVQRTVALASAVEHAGPSVGSTPDHAPPLAPADCPDCRQLAKAGNFLLGSAVAVAAPSASFASLFLTLPAPSSRRSISHAWRSRGPPGAAAPSF